MTMKLGQNLEIRKNMKAQGAVPFNTFVKFGTAMTQAALCGAGENAMGVAEYDLVMYNPDNSVRTGYLDKQIIRVRREGIAIVKTGAPVVAGAYVKSDATGRAITYTKPTVTAGGVTVAEAEAIRDMGEICQGRALTAADAADKLIEVDLEDKP